MRNSKNIAKPWVAMGCLMLGVMLAGCSEDKTSDRGEPQLSTREPLVASSDSQHTTLIGTTWEWVSTVTPVERIEAIDPARYILKLEAEGTVTAEFDCNKGQGSYEMKDNQISFGVFAATRMACPDDTQDYQFMSQLEKITSYFVHENELFLEMPADSGTMRFRSARKRINAIE